MDWGIVLTDVLLSGSMIVSSRLFVINSHFWVFISMDFCFIRDLILLKVFWSSNISFDAMAISSMNAWIWIFWFCSICLRMSSIYIKNSVGANTLPCGTPLVGSIISLCIFMFIESYIVSILFINALFDSFILLSLFIFSFRMFLSTQSNAFFKSISNILLSLLFIAL